MLMQGQSASSSRWDQRTEGRPYPGGKDRKARRGRRRGRRGMGGIQWGVLGWNWIMRMIIPRRTSLIENGDEFEKTGWGLERGRRYFYVSNF